MKQSRIKAALLAAVVTLSFCSFMFFIYAVVEVIIYIYQNTVIDMDLVALGGLVLIIWVIFYYVIRGAE